MKLDIATLFPEAFDGPLSTSIVRRARERGIVDITVHDIRDYAEGPHRQADDYGFGGGAGMVLKVEPVSRLLEHILGAAHPDRRLVLLSPQGKPFVQTTAEDLAGCPHLVMICGHYKGIDERIRLKFAPEEVSLGDYVLSGGELPAMVVADAVIRLLPGAVSDEDSVRTDSFQDGLLDHPHYTRPRVFEGMEVPGVLLSGDHERIRSWRRERALEKTRAVRPDLLERTGPAAT